MNSCVREIAEGVFYCGFPDRDRRIFDQLVPLSQGTTYNSYAVKGALKTALVDTMYAKFENEYMRLLSDGGIVPDYIIANHAEPDHSGAVPCLLARFPKAEVLCTAKCAQNLKNMLRADASRIRAVSDGEELDLGGRTLRFMEAPWVHWPDTMFTYCEKDGLLFTCDLFGAHYTEGGIFADCGPSLEREAKRYYSEIMMPFRGFCAKYLQKIRAMRVKTILPSHGPVYDKPEFIENLYERWTSPEVSRKVVLAYVSMYGSSLSMAEALAKSLEKRGVEVVRADLMEADEGDMASALVDAAGMVFATPMVLSGPHPKSVYAAYLANILRPKLKFYAVAGSYGWGGKLDAPIDAMFTVCKPQKLDTVTAPGKPSDDDFRKLDALAEKISGLC